MSGVVGVSASVAVVAKRHFVAANCNTLYDFGSLRAVSLSSEEIFLFA